MTPDEATGPQQSEYYGSLPDSNTAEAILYGDAYSWIKSAQWAWAEMEDYLLRKIDSLDGQVMDREWAYEVLSRNRYLIFSRTPPVNEVARLQDLFTLRSLVKCAATLKKIREYREQNVAWARMKGIQQYVKSLEGRGISEMDWKAATSDYTMRPIDYDSVHGIVPEMMPGEAVDWDEAMADLMGEKEYNAMLDKMFGEGGDFEDEDGLSEDGQDDYDGYEDEDEDEGGEEGPASLRPHPPWEGYAEDLELMFGLPDVALVSSHGEGGGDASMAADLWDDLDIDDRAIVDLLIGLAKEAVA